MSGTTTAVTEWMLPKVDIPAQYILPAVALQARFCVMCQVHDLTLTSSYCLWHQCLTGMLTCLENNAGTALQMPQNQLSY